MAGDRAALEQQLVEHRERVQRYVATMVGDADAHDLTQEAFRRAVDKLDALARPESLRSWLFAIAVNLCREHLRRGVERERTLVFDPAGLRSSVLSSIVHRESAAALALAIDRLPILLREAFVLQVVEGMVYSDIAAVTGATVAALQVRVHRAKGLLRKQLGAGVDTFWS